MLKECRPICLSPADICGITFAKIYSSLFCLSLSCLLLLFLLVLCERNDSPKRTETSGKACRGVRKRTFEEGSGNPKPPFPLARMQIWARLHIARSGGTTRAPRCRVSVQRSSVLCARRKAGALLGAVLGGGGAAISGSSREAPPSRLPGSAGCSWVSPGPPSPHFLRSIPGDHCKMSFDLFASHCVFAGPGIPPERCSASTGRSKWAEPCCVKEPVG